MHNLKRLLILFACISFLLISRAIGVAEDEKKEIQDLKQIISQQNKTRVKLQKQLSRLNEKVASLEREASIQETMLNRQTDLKAPLLVSSNETNWDKIIHINLGFAYAMKGKIEEAIEEYKKALEYDPEDKDIYYNLGCLLAKRNRYEEAIEEYKKAIKGSAEDKEVYYNLAVIYAAAIKNQEIANLYYQKFLDNKK